jgi:hypothetical protein
VANIDKLLYRCPLHFPDYWDDYCYSIIRYKTSIEVECDHLFRSDPHKIVKDSKNIEYIIGNSSTTGEYRFTFAPGLQGLKGLYNVCEFLKENCIYSESGIHIHVDMSDVSLLFTDDRLGQHVKDGRFDWVLNELDSWGYEGSYNPREIRYTKGGWAGFRNRLYTCEFRICEMTFEYHVLLKRIEHCNNIICNIKKDLLSLYPELVDKPKEALKEDEVNRVISSRNILFFND